MRRNQVAETPNHRFQPRRSGLSSRQRPFQIVPGQITCNATTRAISLVVVACVLGEHQIAFLRGGLQIMCRGTAKNPVAAARLVRAWTQAAGGLSLLDVCRLCLVAFCATAIFYFRVRFAPRRQP